MKADGQTPHKGSNELLKHLRTLEAQRREREELEALKGKMTEMEYLAFTAKWGNN